MKKYLKILLMGLGGLLAIFAIFVAWNWQGIQRTITAGELYEHDNLAYGFSHMHTAYITAPVKRSGDVFTFGSNPVPLPETYAYKGQTKNLQEFMANRSTTGLVVVKDDQITYENYFMGTKETDRRIAHSVSKSVVSAIMGVFVHEGLIDIEKPVNHYVPMLNGSGYEGVRVKDVLQMSSGIIWDEDYGSFNSDINKMARAVSFGGSLDELASELRRGWEPGTKFEYVSMDTHVLSMVTRAVSGKSLAELTEEYIWSKIGMEDDAYWITDTENAAMALGGLNARTRDFARFGRLFLNNGNWDGEQVIPENWVKASITPDSEHIMPTSEKLGYGYQWWLPPSAREGEFMAIGIYGQFIYINQPEGVVIAMNAVNQNFMEDFFVQCIHIFRTITDSLSTKQ